MPIYHFNVQDGVSLPDEVGHELPDLETAKREAVLLAGALIRELGADFWQGDEWRMCVTDHDGRQLFTLLFAGTMAGA
ncbi:DUF6894 family protein [Sphingobium ummariense]|uniref:DUF6894 domain-containing protein n=1 Tax=Sphingobium ummariense RL-3 TaxID=1346791 RepID=T0K9Z6_9SPHN|nr:hypothetical protein [Sphingobium ummariense]EQB33529.1 hypothetical protein M529_03740 [Sphingobium ummariense RL-3]